MTKTLFKTMLSAMFTLTAVAAATGCAVDAEENQTPAPAEEAAAETTGTANEELRIGGGSGGGSTSLWCACKLGCDNTYPGMPVLIKACKAQCDTDNKCRKSVIGGGGRGLFIH